ncbi:MAG: hypothetical protein IIU00_02535 [Clostridia bacterium]|nr:hypothetical protein [Clostridia bacterium]
MALTNRKGRVPSKAVILSDRNSSLSSSGIKISSSRSFTSLFLKKGHKKRADKPLFLSNLFFIDVILPHYLLQINAIILVDCGTKKGLARQQFTHRPDKTSAILL